MVACSRKKKAQCMADPSCVWVPGKGCKKASRSRSPRRKPLVPPKPRYALPKKPVVPPRLKRKSRSRSRSRTKSRSRVTMQKLEKLLHDYAKDMSNAGLKLKVSELFEGGLSDMGYEDLDDAIYELPIAEVRKLAKKVFKEYSKSRSHMTMQKLEKLLHNYAKDMSNEGFKPKVSELFEHGLSDMGYEDLDDAIYEFPDSEVRKLAKKVFDQY